MDSSDSPVESDRLNKRCFPTPGPAPSWWHDAVDGLNKGQVNIWNLRMEASNKNTHIHIYLYLYLYLFYKSCTLYNYIYAMLYIYTRMYTEWEGHRNFPAVLIWPCRTARACSCAVRWAGCSEQLRLHDGVERVGHPGIVADTRVFRLLFLLLDVVKLWIVIQDLRCGNFLWSSWMVNHPIIGENMLGSDLTQWLHRGWCGNLQDRGPRYFHC